jgi:hypothetical protein
MMKPKEEVSIDLEDGRSWRERNPCVSQKNVFNHAHRPAGELSGFVELFDVGEAIGFLSLHRYTTSGHRSTPVARDNLSARLYLMSCSLKEE